MGPVPERRDGPRLSTTSMPTDLDISPVQLAIKDYHALIARDRSAAIEGVARLHDEMRQRGLASGDRLICPFLRPFFLSRPEYEQIRAVVKLMRPAFDLVVEKALSDSKWLDWLGLNDIEKQLIRFDPGFKAASAMARLDSFFTPASFKFIDFNAEFPSGIGYDDAMAEAFSHLPLFKQFRKTRKVRFVASQPSLVHTLIASYKQWGGKNKPQIAIISWEDSQTRSELELIKDSIQSHGFKVIICDPRHLELRKGKLYYRDFRIDLVYRALRLHEMQARLKDCLPMAEAGKAGKVCIVNSFRTMILHKKAVFAALYEDQIQAAMSPAIKQAVLEYIPWTRKVTDRRVILNGKEIELLAYIEGNRRKLVLKPNDDSEESGIAIGWETEQDEWNLQIRKAMEGDYVVQQRIDVRRELFPDTRDNLRLKDMLVDTGSYVFAGKSVGGIQARLSASSFFDIAHGGAQVPTFIIEG